VSSTALVSPDVQAEILKLARVLGCEPASLGYLKDVPAADIRTLREQVTDVLFSAHSNSLGRVAAASKLLPIRVVAAIGERAFGPMLSARIAGLLDPNRAVEMAITMPIPFLADVAVELDPRRASAVITRIPPERIALITRELLRREEYVTMGRFVGHLADGSVQAAVGEMDEHTLLCVAFVLENKDGLDELIDMLPSGGLDRIVEVAAREGLWVEALDLLSHLSEERRGEIARHASALDDQTREQLIERARAAGMEGQLALLEQALGL
jgi:hypothetical protein